MRPSATAASPEPSPLTLARRESVTALGLTLTAVVAWAFLAWAVIDMNHPLARLMMPLQADWSFATISAVFFMWSAMMLAMMLPAATPMLLTFAALCRQKNQQRRGLVFVFAYVVIWTAFSAAATLLHWWLQASGLISPAMASDSIWLTGFLLLAAGAVQFTRLKQACLRYCRTPMGFLLTQWRDGTYGAWRMGIRHGLVCLGCCWALMGLLFIAGVMNLAWVAALSVAVIVEKLHPAGVRLGRALGVILIVAGSAQLALLATV